MFSEGVSPLAEGRVLQDQADMLTSAGKLPQGRGGGGGRGGGAGKWTVRWGLLKWQNSQIINKCMGGHFFSSYSPHGWNGLNLLLYLKCIWSYHFMQ